MGNFLLTFVLLCHSLLLLFGLGFSLPLCINSRTPSTLDTALKFCPYNETSCCDSKQDLMLQRQYEAMNISDSGCASVIKSVLCSKCDPFSRELFVVDSVTKPVPLLCNSTTSPDSPQSDQASADFCSDIWDTCQNVTVLNSPFAPPLLQSGIPLKSNATKLTEVWQSRADFCSAFGGSSSSGSVCFSGEPVSLNGTEADTNPPAGMCLEKIGKDAYLSMAPHPDGSNRAFFSTQKGKVYLATIPEQGSGESLGLDESSPFVDLTDQVNFDTQFGMMGMAFHPKFDQNGRFFASFNCDKTKWPGCTGRCACNSDVDCDPSKLPPDNGAQPCQHQTVVAEYTANGTETDPSKATSARPVEVRRIFTMGLPFTSNHGGQILFGPDDGYLYFMMGDGGGNSGDHKFSQNKKSLLGKVMRLDVDNIPSAAEIDKLGLWGNYSAPKDNPFKEDPELQPEIWALGLRNPWRCSFDSKNPSYFLCGDTGEDLYEEVDLITKAGNYGWPVYEGLYPFVPANSASSRNISKSSIKSIFPVLGYNHSEVNTVTNAASISGGFVYRGQTDPCMYGRYLYGDLYGEAMWAAFETPESSGKYKTDRIPFSCAADSPMLCGTKPGNTLPNLGYVFSFAQDNQKDVFILTNNGVFRVVRPSRCKYTCSKESLSVSPSPVSPPSGSASRGLRLSDTCSVVAVLVVALLSLWSSFALY